MNKIITFLKPSNRYKHLIGGLLVGIVALNPWTVIEVSGEPKKFFTNSEEMKNILQQVSEVPDGFPFETTIKSETFGKGRTKYIFT